MSFPPLHQAPPAQDPNAMEIDAATPTVPFTHMGSLECPNQGVTRKQRKAFVSKHCSNPGASVLAVDIAPSPVDLVIQPLTYKASPALVHNPLELAANYAANQVNPDAPFLGNYQGFNKVYEEFDAVRCAIKEVPLATVHIRLDCSKKDCLLVPASWGGE
ncbi:hypothetical protein PCASD_21518 [Puccinia coronata f. sp. avenae]|uniref:Uncharacterized protein n=1 Tax=Puccinia coronata f. sp. avenae TaxID=200324 RepID=A0A2N5SPC6_9BASI|nr:hypothetical protein PCASD_21518 [Puccinia coronata f. sp. avenae]